SRGFKAQRLNESSDQILLPPGPTEDWLRQEVVNHNHGATLTSYRVDARALLHWFLRAHGIEPAQPASGSRNLSGPVRHFRPLAGKTEMNTSEDNAPQATSAAAQGASCASC